jgi:hypothetical protein
MSLFSFPSQVNERAARLVASGVVITLAAALLFGAAWLVPLLALGFLLRVGWGPKASPLARIAVAAAGRFEARLVSGAPKRFAQGIGASFSLAASALLFTGHPRAGWILAGVLLFFATLEAVLGFCAGCFAYARLQAWGLLPPDACVDCAPRASS